MRKAPAGTLSYGLRKRVELARAMAIEPELILLDEPMAGMNLEEKEDMARYILDLNEEFGMTVIMIEHDMGVVMDISDRVDGAGFRQEDRRRSPEEVMADEHVKRAYLGEEDEALVDPERRRHAGRGAGMIAADRRAARRWPIRFPSCCGRMRASISDDIALREKDLGIWDAYSWADYLDPCPRFRARPAGARRRTRAMSLR